MLSRAVRFFIPALIVTGLIFSSQMVSAQDKNQDKAVCLAVLKKSADKSGKTYSSKGCDGNVYPARFWRCVDKELDTFELNIAIGFCEQSYGYK